MRTTTRTAAVAFAAASLLTQVLTASAASMSMTSNTSPTTARDDSTGVQFSTADRLQPSNQLPTANDGTDTQAPDATDRTTALQQSGFDPLQIRNAERNIIGLFTQVGALDHPMTLDLSKDSVDMAAYVSDPCYVVTGSLEQRDCTARFGPYADLSRTLRDGRLKDILNEQFPLLMFSGQGQAMDRIFQQASDSTKNGMQRSSDTQTDQDMNGENADDTDVLGEQDSGMAPAMQTAEQDMHERSTELWQECESIAGDWQASCYQRNIRLLDKDVPVSGNVYFQVEQ